MACFSAAALPQEGLTADVASEELEIKTASYFDCSESFVGTTFVVLEPVGTTAEGC